MLKRDIFFGKHFSWASLFTLHYLTSFEFTQSFHPCGLAVVVIASARFKWNQTPSKVYQKMLINNLWGGMLGINYSPIIPPFSPLTRVIDLYYPGQTVVKPKGFQTFVWLIFHRMNELAQKRSFDVQCVTPWSNTNVSITFNWGSLFHTFL